MCEERFMLQWCLNEHRSEVLIHFRCAKYDTSETYNVFEQSDSVFPKGGFEHSRRPR